MNEVITIQGVHGYMGAEGMARLRLEDVARGLGFTEVAGSGNEVVRWRTVRKYLADMGIATSCDGSKPRQSGNDGLPEFIPENIFYKLCFKASNETARRFQDLVTDEILPSIRKTGQYAAVPKKETVLEVSVDQFNRFIESQRDTVARLIGEYERARGRRK